MAVTLRFQSTGAVPGSGAPITMQGGNLTIGRGQDNDLVLPDPDRMISKRHCVIEDHNGNVVVIDLSTNGTFLNYGKVPLGNVPTPLNDGDVLSMGAYEMVVDMGAALQDPSQNIAPPLADAPVSHGDASQGAPTGDILDDPAGGPDFLDDLLGSPEGPTGPSQIQREDPSDALLPPLGEDDLLAPLPEEPAVTGASIPQHSPSATDAFSAPQSGAAVIPDDWDDDLLGSPDPAPESIPTDPFAEPPTAPAPPAAEAPAVPEPQAPEDTRPPAAVAPAGPDTASQAFLAAAGASGIPVGPDEMSSTMDRLGKVFRIMVEGLREVLMTRTSIKSEFRINQTMIGAHGNNPLKFSISPEQAVEALVRPQQKGYLEASQAAQEALDDIKAHEVAMVTGMEAALKGVLAKLDPKALEGQIETGGALGSLLKGKKARYWEVYEKMYGEIAEQAENDFHELFAREFARAYQEQLEKLK